MKLFILLLGIDERFLVEIEDNIKNFIFPFLETERILKRKINNKTSCIST